MYCGVIGSRNSQPTGRPSPSTSSSRLARLAQARVHVARAVEVRVVDQALPADRRARLLEVDAHRDAEVVARARRPSRSGAARTRARRRRRGRCTGRRRRAGGRPRGRGRPTTSDGRAARPRRARRRAAARGTASAGVTQRHGLLDPLVADVVEVSWQRSSSQLSDSLRNWARRCGATAPGWGRRPAGDGGRSAAAAAAGRTPS